MKELQDREVVIESSQSSEDEDSDENNIQYGGDDFKNMQ